MPTRMISPDFWTDTAMIQLPMPIRLFYIGTWNFACSAGHLPDDPLQLKLKVLPADPIDGAEFIDALVSAGRLQRVTIPDGSKFLLIPSFPKHQKQDSRYQSRCAACRATSNPTETPASLSEISKSPQISRLGGGGVEGGDKGEGESRGNALTRPPRYCSDHPKGTTSNCVRCRDARISRDDWDADQKAAPTRTPTKDPDCPVHPDWPMPCDKCAALEKELK